MTAFSFLFKPKRNASLFKGEGDFALELNPLVQIYYFGSFNPVHMGHLHIAKDALAVMHSQGFREVVFIPTPSPPNKTEKLRTKGYPLLPVRMRLELLKASIEDLGLDNYFKALPLEGTVTALDAPSYTVDTLKHYFGDFLKEAPQQKIYLVMGEDTLATLPHWYKASWLMRHVHCIVLPRPTHYPPQASLDLATTLRQSFGLGMTRLRLPAPYVMNATAIREGGHSAWLTPTVSQHFKKST
jgi:nicotinate-nucleotide adenylyltransferase